MIRRFINYVWHCEMKPSQRYRLHRLAEDLVKPADPWLSFGPRSRLELLRERNNRMADMMIFELARQGITVHSSYRTREDQQHLFEQAVAMFRPGPTSHLHFDGKE